MPSTRRRSYESETRRVVVEDASFASRVACPVRRDPPNRAAQQTEADSRNFIQAVGGDFDGVTDARRAGEADGACPRRHDQRSVTDSPSFRLDEPDKLAAQKRSVFKLDWTSLAIDQLCVKPLI